MQARRAHLVLYVADQEASRSFYTHILDAAPTLDVPGMTEIPLSSGAVLAFARPIESA